MPTSADVPLDVRQLATEVGQPRPMRRGSVSERTIRCGKPNCACAKDHSSWHGPYFQLSWKEKGKTVSRRLLPEHAALYRQWVANRQRLQSIVHKMQQVSHKARRHLLKAEELKKVTPKPGDIRRSPR